MRPYYLVSPPLSPRAYLRRRARRLPFPLADEDCTIYSCARRALWHGVRALGLGEGDEVLVPEYHCGTEIEALQNAGLGLCWYELDRRLEPKEPALNDLIGARTRALFLIHYLGFPQDLARWRRWCDFRGLLLFEDAAPAWLASIDGAPVGSVGDLSIFSFRKTYGIPDGGAVVSNAHGAPTASARGLGLPMLARRHAEWAAMRSRLFGSALATWGVRRPVFAEEDYGNDSFGMGDPWTPPQRTSLAFLARLSDESTAARRRENYRYLLDRLGEHVLPPFDRLPEGSSPTMFPITTESRDELIGRLRHRGVHAVVNWPVPHPSFPADRFTEAAERRATTVCLPVHQELKRRDVERIAEAAAKSLEEVGATKLPAPARAG
jgi:dTDP-4-amino-4,6-dideoxygalactose transaminase